MEENINIEVIIYRYACTMLTYNIVDEMKRSMPIQSSYVYVYLSNLIGVSVSNNGKILYGTHDTAANYSHTIVTDSNYICSCGKIGCWESVVSIKAFMRELANKDDKYKYLDFNDIINGHLNDDAVIDVYII